MADAPNRLITTLREAAHPLRNGAHDLDPLLDSIGDARFVLIGEASHGTNEFHRERARLTRRLVEEKGFHAIALDADWPDAARVNRWARGLGEDGGADEALDGFRRFPTWMWRNPETVSFLEWLREQNDGRPATERLGVYGLDLFRLHASMEAVVAFLETVDRAAAERARYRYSCFDHFGDDVEAYGYATGFSLTEDRKDELAQRLIALHTHAPEHRARDGALAEDADFQAGQNARLAKCAESYYRLMFRGRVASWNLRERHMAETLEALVEHLDTRVGTGKSKVVVWQHNSHAGDARATQMANAGAHNVGQLVRERWGAEAAFLVGFTTWSGTVTAASDWGMPAERKRVRRALAESWEAAFHETGFPRFLLTMRGDPGLAKALRDPRLERAIGMVYRPESERVSHYLHAAIGEQFDAVIHLDETRALEPLERTAGWEMGEIPETISFHAAGKGGFGT